MQTYHCSENPFLKKKIVTKSGKKLLIKLMGIALKSFIGNALNSSFLIINYLKTVSLSGIKNICEIAV
ncbi:hypothetical protein SAMN05421682_1171 [Chryseobacterium indoltheticum]|uniref:Uncharacterized protein n=1 Tax=Chryseobacterium indoltheticum TaxID=254 RepID=A0A381F9A2_9FLAO|nr:hypothetical protein EG358_06110 [Chryseobacterium indoltheticum]SIR30270.1 hypothetical protein SAMN05421682_1171 [Chryseobacterium indoltheticum]SUX43151.1 Uncharacterised protein [Chryseobacterium indoltheticum]